MIATRRRLSEIWTEWLDLATSLGLDPGDLPPPPNPPWKLYSPQEQAAWLDSLAQLARRRRPRYRIVRLGTDTPGTDDASGLPIMLPAGTLALAADPRGGRGTLSALAGRFTALADRQRDAVLVADATAQRDGPHPPSIERIARRLDVAPRTLFRRLAGVPNEAPNGRDDRRNRADDRLMNTSNARPAPRAGEAANLSPGQAPVRPDPAIGAAVATR